MAIYTLLTRTAIRGLLRRYGLPPPRRYSGLKEGTVNTYYKVVYPRQTYFLKIDELRDERRLQREIRILSWLGARQEKWGYRIPLPLKTTNGKFFVPYNSKAVLLFARMPGRSIPAHRLTAHHLYQIGRALGQLHRLRGPANLSKHRFDLRGIKDVYAGIRAPLHKNYPTVALEIRQWLLWLGRQRPPRLPAGLIHADLFADNLHFEKNRLVAILDFEAAGRGPFIFDLAVALHALGTVRNRFHAKRCRAILGGYTSVRRLRSTEKAGLHRALYESGLRFLLTRLRDFTFSPHAAQHTHPLDFKDYLIRLPEIANFKG